VTNPPRDKIRFQVVLEGERASETAHLHTLRFLLKHLLRSRSLRCIDAKEIGAGEEEPRS
jgi:hypothetical protein